MAQNNPFAPIFAALKSAGISGDEARKQLIYDFSQGRTASLKELSAIELQELLRFLNKDKPVKSGISTRQQRQTNLLYKLAIDSMWGEKRAKLSAQDWQGVHNYIQSITGKKVKDFETEEQMQAALDQMRGVLENNERQRRRDNTNEMLAQAGLAPLKRTRKSFKK